MKQSIITELTLYRYRYIIGYGLFFLLLAFSLIVAGLFIPGGLTKVEQASVVSSMNISFHSPFNLPAIDLPYHLLQKLTISMLGLTIFAIKLPSLILGAISGVALFFLLKEWFRPNIAILSGVITITTSQFIVISQSGTPTIMLFFWSIILLLVATYLSRLGRHRLMWKVVFSITAALSLYTPLSIYVLAAMLTSALLHPHLRSILKEMSRLRILLASLSGGLLLIPLLINIINQPSTLLALLGLENMQSVDVWKNMSTLAKNLFDFAHPAIGPEAIMPLLGIPVTILTLLGLMRLIADHHSARAYALIIWLVPMTLILIFQPHEIAIAFMPLMLLLAIGIEALIYEWYGLFPQNPYARIAALIPLAILLGGIAFSGMARYQDSFRYHPDVAHIFSQDLGLIRDSLKGNGENTALVIPRSQKEFYAFLNREFPKLTITSKLSTYSDRVIITPRQAKNNALLAPQPSKLITSSYSQDGLRFYIYKSNGWQ